MLRTPAAGLDDDLVGTLAATPRPLRIRMSPTLLRIAVGWLAFGLVGTIATAALLALADRPNPAALVLAGAVAVTGLVVGARMFRIRTEVDGGELRGNGFATPMVHVPFDEIAQVRFIPTVSENGRVVEQLLVTGLDGRRLFRVRGTFWTPGALDDLAEELPGFVSRTAPVPMTEFWERYPGSAYWFENRRSVRIVLVGAVTIVAVLTGSLVGLALAY